MNDALTARELDIIRALARGQSNATIGTALGISIYTVKTHSERARRKLRARNTTHAVALCYERDLFCDWPNRGT